MEYDFVKKPAENYFCPVTSVLLLEPHQTLCCRKHLQEEAVTQLKRKKARCPLCGNPALRTVPDLFLKLIVKQIEVRCPNHGDGCEWEGQLGNLDQHLKENAAEGECQFVKLSCPYSCGKRTQRRLLLDHTVLICSKRPFTCQYCGHNDSYDKITKGHYSVCKKHPVACPNQSKGCKWNGERGNLDRHLSSDGSCLYIELACPNSCGERLQRRSLLKHKAECTKRPFTCRFCGYKATYEKVKKDHWPNCQKYTLPCPNECSEKLFERQHISKHLDEDCPLQEVECEFKCSGCNTKLQRRFMQTHLNENTKTHLSMVLQLNQTVEKKVERQESTIQQQQEIIDQLRHMIEQQQRKLEQHAAEYQNMAERQRKIEQQQGSNEQEQRKQQGQIDGLVSSLNHSHAVLSDITMTNFKDNKKAKVTDWYSCPFYSHIGGYKMCLRVAANGQGDGEGTHVSVYVHLMRGKHDDHLQWPFRGVITIRLLNQKRDEQHRQQKLTFDRRTSSYISCRVTGREVATGGQGCTKFIAHNQLVPGLFAATSCEYLKTDCLKFQIVEITVDSIQ